MTPTLISTSGNAMNRFTPEERDCYSEDEISLKYLPHSHGYRYEMSNCLFESAFENILKECKCCPGKSSVHSCKVLHTCKQGIFFTTNSKVCFKLFSGFCLKGISRIILLKVVRRSKHVVDCVLTVLLVSQILRLFAANTLSNPLFFERGPN